MENPPQDPGDVVVPLYVEEVAVERRRLTRKVKVHVKTTSREQLVDEDLFSERIEIERVPINQQVDTAPPVREEGDTTVIPVVAEELVVERRLILKEEVRLRRVRTADRHRETIALREQHAVVERADAGEGPGASAVEPAPIPKSHSLKEQGT